MLKNSVKIGSYKIDGLFLQRILVGTLKYAPQHKSGCLAAASVVAKMKTVAKKQRTSFFEKA